MSQLKVKGEVILPSYTGYIHFVHRFDSF